MKRQIQLLVESLFDDDFNDIYNSDDIDLDLSSKLRYNYYPKTVKELRALLIQLLDERGNDADLNDIDVSKITSFYDKDSYSGLFQYLDPHNIDISQWDVSNVKDMTSMFCHCRNFKSDLSKWDVSNVTDMFNMFYECQNFKSDLSKWDVSNVTDMSRMFYNCKKFNCDLNQWDVSNVISMYSMFNGCYSLKIIPKWYKNGIKK